MAEGTGEFDYDRLLVMVKKLRDDGNEPCWVVARSVESAEAFAAWCTEAGIEEPEILIPCD
jgi:hypothetical protein